MRLSATIAMLMLSTAGASASSFVTLGAIEEKISPSMIVLGAGPAPLETPSIIALGEPGPDYVPEIEQVKVASIVRQPAEKPLRSQSRASEQRKPVVKIETPKAEATPYWIVDQMALAQAQAEAAAKSLKAQAPGIPDWVLQQMAAHRSAPASKPMPTDAVVAGVPAWVLDQIALNHATHAEAAKPLKRNPGVPGWVLDQIALARNEDGAAGEEKVAIAEPARRAARRGRSPMPMVIRGGVVGEAYGTGGGSPVFAQPAAPTPQATASRKEPAKRNEAPVEAAAPLPPSPPLKRLEKIE